MEISLEYARQKDWISPRTAAVYDYDFIKALREIPWAEWVETPNSFRIRQDYLDKYYSWICAGSRQQIQGLDQFPIRHLTNGSTQSFDEYFFMNSHRRLRVFRGEYAYHRRVFKNWQFLEDEELHPNDFVIVSAPFCSTGEVHPQMNTLLDCALKLNVPVMMDCAYVGTCWDIELNMDHPAIEIVCFSLTKGLGLGDIRSGIRFSRKDNLGPISQQNHYDHSVLCAAKIGLYMMERFSVDHIPNKFRDSQVTVCEIFGLTPTPVMHIALGDSDWDEFKVDELYNRVGIRQAVKAQHQGRLVAPDHLSN